MDNVNVVLVIILVASVLIVAIPFVVLYAKDNKKGTAKLLDCKIEHELEFGGLYVKISIADFNKLGFEFGDSVNIHFSNGYSYRDLPYYNGYYTSTGEPLLLGYPGADYIKVAISNGDDLWHLADLEAKNLGAEKNLLWEMANLKEDTTVSIILSQKAKYLTIQQARDIHYYDERDLYATDEEYANFRAIKVAS